MSLYPVAKIDLAALKHNLNQVRQFAPNSRVMSVIKANAYGHGVIEVADALCDSDAFAVARLAEALQLRQVGISKPIVVLEGVSDPAALTRMALHQLSPVLHLAEQVQLVAEANQLDQPLPACWLMVETGMNRLGIAAEQIPLSIVKLQQSANIAGKIGLMSHFANSDLVGDARNQQQLDVILPLAQETGLEVCFANSAAVMTFAASHQQWVRPGLMLYGVSPFSDRNGIEMGLKPVMQLSSQIMSIHQLQPGDEVGYGGTWTAPKSMSMAVVNIGYGDGYHRHLSNCGQVLVRDKLLPIIGRVSMDSICISLENCDQAQVGDEVILWGHEKLAVEQMAQLAGTIPYELVTVVCERVQRMYVNG